MQGEFRHLVKAGPISEQRVCEPMPQDSLPEEAIAEGLEVTLLQFAPL